MSWTNPNPIQKHSYNEGNKIATSADPVWSVAHTGIPITPTHVPCGYWFNEPYVLGENPPVSGDLYSTGWNSVYQLIREGTTNQDSFGEIDGSYSIIDMSLSASSGAFITDAGVLYVIGGNASGELGTGDKVAVASATAIATDCAKVNLSWTQSMYVIKTDGSLWSCGRNGNGDLGVGDTTERLVLTAAAAGPFKQVSSGYYGCFAIKTDGTLWATGSNGNGQLGFGVGDTTQRTSFEQVGSKTWGSISKSGEGRFGVGVDSAGAIFGCGLCGHGETCLDDTANYQVFTARGDGNIWDKVIVGSSHSIALKLDGTLHTAGYNSSGQLGSGDNSNEVTLTQIGSDTWIDVSAGQSVSMGIKTGGTVWGTGSNTLGTLGTGAFPSVTSFTASTGITAAIRLACSGYFTYAFKAN